MLRILLVVTVAIVGALALDVNGTNPDKSLQGCSYTATCTSGGIEGVCVSVSSGCCTGSTTSGLCPGSSDIMCCTNNACSTPWGSGSCVQTSKCSGTSYSGYCTGPSDIQCCVGGGPVPNPTPTPPGRDSIGVDISQALSSSTASCFKSSGVTFIVPRGYKSTGSVDSAACGSLNAAMFAGIATRDVYMFPCPTCSKSAATQLSELVSAMQSGCSAAWSGRIWLDIEGSQYWTGSTSSNKAWYENLVDTCKSQVGTKNCGIYSSSSQWSAIFGSSSFAYGSDLPLWYAHYDGSKSFSDFSSFGGWSSPHAKQYQGDISLCSFGVDMDWSASSF